MHTSKMDSSICRSKWMRETVCHMFYRPMRRTVVAYASKQQQQQQQQQSDIPAAVSYKELKQQFQGLVASAPQPLQKQGPASSSSREQRSTPRLKPTRQTASPPGSLGTRRAAGAAAPAGAGAATKAGGSPPATGKPKKATAAAGGSRSGSSSQIGNKRSSSSSTTTNNSSSSSSSSSRSWGAKLPAGSLLPSNGRGFGAATAANSDDVVTSNSKSNSTSGSSSSGALRVFRYGVESAPLQRAIEASGWQGRVLQVASISQADVILAVKTTPSGKHRNLAQGERAATNAGIPFVVLGRKLSKDNLVKALLPYVAPDSPEAAALVTAAAEAASKSAENKAAADAWFGSASAWHRR